MDVATDRTERFSAQGCRVVKESLQMKDGIEGDEGGAMFPNNQLDNFRPALSTALVAVQQGGSSMTTSSHSFSAVELGFHATRAMLIFSITLSAHNAGTV